MAAKKSGADEKYAPSYSDEEMTKMLDDAMLEGAKKHYGHHENAEHFKEGEHMTPYEDDEGHLDVKD